LALFRLAFKLFAVSGIVNLLKICRPRHSLVVQD